MTHVAAKTRQGGSFYFSPFVVRWAYLCFGRSLGQLGRKPFNCQSLLHLRLVEGLTVNDSGSCKHLARSCMRLLQNKKSIAWAGQARDYMHRPAARRYMRCINNGRRRQTTAWRRGQPSLVPDPTLADCTCTCEFF